MSQMFQVEQENINWYGIELMMMTVLINFSFILSYKKKQSVP